MSDHSVQIPLARRGLGSGSTERLTIGLFDWSITDTLGYDMWAGVADAAREHGANVVCVLGGTLAAVPGEPGSEGNVLYDLVSAESIDGLVMWSALFHQLTPEQVNAFYGRYRSLPMVNVGSLLEGIPSVLADNYQGMRDELVHLIEVHGYRRIAYIRGPEIDEEAADRYRAYSDVLTHYGLAREPNLIAPGNNQAIAGSEAIRLWLDERGLRPGVDFEAVVASNDNMAFAASDALQARGIRVPYDVAVAGFDDIAQAASLVPVTTVRYPFYEQGRRALEILLALLAGEEVPAKATVPLEVVVRRSCGCLSPAVARAAMGPSDRTSVQTEDVLGEIRQAAGEMPVNVASDWAGQLLDAFKADIGDGSSGRFLVALDGLLRQGMGAGGDVGGWQEVISVLRRSVLPDLDGDARPRAEDLWQQARVMISEAAQRAAVIQASQAGVQEVALSAASQALNACVGLGELVDTVAQQLPNLGIVGCYLALYEDPDDPVGGSRLMLAYDESGRRKLDSDGERFPSRRLALEGVLRTDGPHLMLAQPLHFQQAQQGFVMFKLTGPGDVQTGGVYETMRSQISNALHRVLLVEQEARARAEAEESRRRLAAALEDVQAAQRRYVQDAWRDYGAAAEGAQGYVYAEERVEPTAEEWLPLMTEAVQQGKTMVRGNDGEGTTLAVPLKLYGEVIGVLGGVSPESGTWSEDDVAALEDIVEQMALALESQRLFSDAQRATVLVNERVQALDCLNDIGRWTEEAPPVPDFLRLVAGRVPAALRHSDVCVAAIEFEGQVYGTPEAIGLPRQMVQGLRVAGEVVGRVYIGYTEDHEFLDEESALLGDIARRVGGYIESQRLLEETRANAEEFAVLYELGRSLTGQLDLDQVLEEIYRGVSRLMDAANFYIGLYDPERHQIVFPLDVTGSVIDRRITILSADEGLTGYVLRTGESLLIEEDVVGWMRSKGIEAVGEAAQSWLGVPLLIGDQVQGVMAVQDYTTPRAFSESHRSRLVAVASQASVAIQNARLFEQIQLRARREQVLREITARVRSSSEPDMIVRTAVRELGTALGRRAFVRLGSVEELSAEGGE
jgi:DNA-binding LacI/PurR family transcriptional regulator/GAF domain-containing protein